MYVTDGYKRMVYMKKLNEYTIRASDCDQVSELEKKHRMLARSIATESIVLLENDGVLPLDKKEHKIALYGNGVRRTIYGGTGSGEVNAREQVSIEQGLINKGIEITTQAWLQRYEEAWIRGKEQYLRAARAKLKRLHTHILAELIASEYQYPYGDEIREDDIKNSDTKTCIYVISRQSGEGRDRKLEQGDYMLSDIEISNLKICAAQYEKCIIVINTGSSIDMRDIDKIKGIDAVVYMSQLGMESGNALADILFGEETPSGHLAATWVHAYEDIPYGNHFGEMASNRDEVDYTEGLLVGYRYYDTKHVPVRYCFGYGLSYTSFASDVVSLIVEENMMKIVLCIKNTGAVYAGKATIGIYAGLCKKEASTEEVPDKVLIGFAKTSVLAPQEVETMQLDIPLERLSCYHERAKTMVIPAGEYIVYAGSDIKHCKPIQQVVISAHTVPNIKSNDVMEKQIEEKVQQLSVKDLITLCVGNGLFSDGLGYQVPGAVGCTTTKFLNQGIRNLILCDGPAGVRLQRKSTINKKGKIKPLDFPISLYELLPQFLVKRMLGDPSKETVIYQFVTGFPVAAAVAQTWNTTLCFAMGEAIGKEMETYGVDLWLAPAINIMRNPLCGRNYEYYSEDPILSGVFATCITKGVQSIPGRGVTIKHFACNNQETNRYHMSSNLSEKVMRDIYLKAFEIVVKEAKPKAIMCAYNKINGVYAASNAHLLQDILRNEWGFQGLVMSDWLSVGKGKANEGESIQAGLDLIMPGNKKNRKQLWKDYKHGDVQKEQLIRAAAHILHLVWEEHYVKN